MALWFGLAMMTAAAIFAVLWPLGRSRRGVEADATTGVYKDQLTEIDRDVASGRISQQDAPSARAEVARRLLAAADQPVAAAIVRPAARRAVAIVGLVGIPLLAAPIYLALGSPRQPDAPLSARSASPGAEQSVGDLVGRVEAHLASNPTDGKGWSVIAPILLKRGRLDDAVAAYRNVIAYLGDSAERRGDLAEAMTFAARGVVTAAAKDEFDRALAIDPKDAKARFYLALAAEQDGRALDAAAMLRAMLADAPADAPYRAGVQMTLARLDPSAAPALDAQTQEAAAAMSDDDRQTMIRGMVARLDTRLKQNGGTPDEWLRLVRAYVTLGDRDRARETSGAARQALAGKADALQTFDSGVKALGLDG